MTFNFTEKVKLDFSCFVFTYNTARVSCSIRIYFLQKKHVVTHSKTPSFCVTGASCTNTVGSFTCSCGAMHTGDGLVSGSGCTPVSNNPCPSTTCWDWNASTGTCSLKAGTNCAQITCNHNTADISFVSALYGVSDNQSPNPFGSSACAPTWDSNSNRWKVTNTLGQCGSTIGVETDSNGAELVQINLFI